MYKEVVKVYTNEKYYKNATIEILQGRMNLTFNTRKKRLTTAVKLFRPTVDKRQWSRRRDLLRFAHSNTFLINTDILKVKHIHS